MNIQPPPKSNGVLLIAILVLILVGLALFVWSRQSQTNPYSQI
jgi:flagellar biosynthesis/type III secretory pathway M-ring protein FliF/YscJ